MFSWRRMSRWTALEELGMPKPCDGQPMTSTTLRLRPRRVAVLSLHTSPLEQPGTGDAGGMNVYIAQTARRLAEHGTEVEILPRAPSSGIPPVAELSPGEPVRHDAAGPGGGLAQDAQPRAVWP